MKKVTVSGKYSSLAELYDLFVQKFGLIEDPPEFRTLTAFNVAALRPVMDILDALMEASEDLKAMQKAYQKDKLKLIQFYAKKNAQGEPIIKETVTTGNTQRQIYDIKSPEALEAAELALRADKYPTLEAAEQKRDSDIRAMLATVVPVDLYPYPASVIPKTGINGNDLSVLIGYNMYELTAEGTK